MQKKRLQEAEKRKKRQIRKGKNKKKIAHSLHLDSKKNTFFSWLTQQLVLAIDLVCSQIFISSSFFVFSSFASFVFFMVCCWVLGFFFFFLFFMKRSLLLGFYSSFWLNFSLVVFFTFFCLFKF